MNNINPAMKYDEDHFIEPLKLSKIYHEGTEEDVIDYLEPRVSDSEREEFNNICQERINVGQNALDRINAGEDADTVINEVSDSFEYALYNYHFKSFLARQGLSELYDEIVEPQKPNEMEV